MIRLKVGIPDFPAIDRTFQILREWVGDLEPIWTEVVYPYLVEHLAGQFDTAGARGGQPWAGYTTEPVYAAYKLAIVGHLRPLVWEDGGEYERLRPSLVDARHPDHIFEADASRMRYGTAVPYADSLNQGGTGPFGEPFPGRKIFALTEGQKKELVTLIQRRMIAQIPAEVRSIMRIERSTS